MSKSDDDYSVQLTIFQQNNEYLTAILVWVDSHSSSFLFISSLWFRMSRRAYKTSWRALQSLSGVSLSSHFFFEFILNNIFTNRNNWLGNEFFRQNCRSDVLYNNLFIHFLTTLISNTIRFHSPDVLMHRSVWVRHICRAYLVSMIWLRQFQFDS